VTHPTADPPTQRPSRRLLLLRHGRTAYNATGRFQGQLDVPLDATGEAQAEKAAAVLAELHPSRVIASDLQRAARTGELVAEACGLELATSPALREINLGGWQGLTGSEAYEQFPDEWDAWQRGEQIRRGDGETYPEVAQRALAVLGPALAELPGDGTLIAVTHGGTARAILGAVLELPEEQWWRIGALGNCAWSVVAEQRAGWRLVGHGITAG
jgi:broad specificity phosphatase PhoE